MQSNMVNLITYLANKSDLLWSLTKFNENSTFMENV